MSERKQLTRRGTITGTIMANVAQEEGSPHLIWTGRISETIMFSQNSRRINVVRYLWENENGPSARRLRKNKTCLFHGCVSPKCYEEIPGSVYHPSHRRSEKTAKDYVRWNATHRRWYVLLIFAGKTVASSSFSKSDYSQALDFAERGLKKVRALREESYSQNTSH